MRYYVEAFTVEGHQILGNLDGQRAWRGADYRRAKWFKTLPHVRTLNNRVHTYRIVREDGRIMGTVRNLTWQA